MKFDYSICEFINQEMQFYSYNDFCDNCFAIKRLYDSLDRNGKRFYMWYIYANVHVNMTLKDRIWDFLNGYNFIEDLKENEKCIKN